MHFELPLGTMLRRAAAIEIIGGADSVTDRLPDFLGGKEIHCNATHLRYTLGHVVWEGCTAWPDLKENKPSNILLDLQGRPLVTDFGLVKRFSEDKGKTVSGQVLGTPGTCYQSKLLVKSIRSGQRRTCGGKS